MLNSSAFFISHFLDLIYFTVLLCGILIFYPTFGPLKLCKEELPNSLFVTAHLTIRMNSNLLPLMMEFEISFFLSVLKQIMHTLTYMTFLLLATLKPAHPPSLNYVIPNPTTTAKVMNFLIEYPDCGTLYIYTSD